MPLGKEGTLTADEVYALTAFLLYINGVVPEDQILDAQSLPKVKMPIGDEFASYLSGSPGREGFKVIPTRSGFTHGFTARPDRY
jgi:cytochrome c